MQDALGDIYCAAYIQAGSPEELESCDCVRGLSILDQWDAIYCVFYTQAGSPTDLPDCDCVRGLSLQDKLSALYEVIISEEPPPEGTASLFIEWTDNSDDEDGFRIEISLNGVDYFTVATVGPNVTEYTITDLEYNTLYYVQVIAFNAYGDSDPAGPIEVYTCTEFGPTNCTATTIDDQSIFVTYVDSVTQPINGGYKVYYKKSSDPTYDPNDFVLNAIGEQEATISGLDGGTSYDFIAVTYNDNSGNVPPQIDSESTPSNTATATTDTPIIVPTMLSAASNVAGTQVTLTASEAVQFGAGGNGGFSSTGRTWTYVSGFTGTTTAVYGVSPSIAFGDVVTVDYTQPGNGVESTSNVDMASFTGLAVTNNVPDPGTNPGLTSIVAWYDFADATDADGGTYNLTEVNGPTYGSSGGVTYGIAADGAPGSYWQQTSLDNNFGAVAGNWSFVCRFQAKTGIANNDLILNIGGSRWSIRYDTSGTPGLVIRAANIIVTVAFTPVVDTWYTVVATWDGTTARASVNGATFVGVVGAPSFAVGTAFFASTCPVWFDFSGFYGKVLTQSNATWLYNGGGTRTYSDL
jgi:hypothetical protein